MQASNLSRDPMADEDREHLIGNVGNARREIQERQVAIFARADADYRRRVAEVRIGISVPKADVE